MAVTRIRFQNLSHLRLIHLSLVFAIFSWLKGSSWNPAVCEHCLNLFTRADSEEEEAKRILKDIVAKIRSHLKKYPKVDFLANSSISFQRDWFPKPAVPPPSSKESALPEVVGSKPPHELEKSSSHAGMLLPPSTSAAILSAPGTSSSQGSTVDPPPFVSEEVIPYSDEVQTPLEEQFLPPGLQLQNVQISDRSTCKNSPSVTLNSDSPQNTDALLRSLLSKLAERDSADKLRDQKLEQMDEFFRFMAEQQPVEEEMDVEDEEDEWDETDDQFVPPQSSAPISANALQTSVVQSISYPVPSVNPPPPLSDPVFSSAPALPLTNTATVASSNLLSSNVSGAIAQYVPQSVGESLRDDRYKEVFWVTPFSEAARVFLSSAHPILRFLPGEAEVSNEGLKVAGLSFGVDEVFIGKVRGRYIAGFFRTSLPILSVSAAWQKAKLNLDLFDMKGVTLESILSSIFCSPAAQGLDWKLEEVNDQPTLSLPAACLAGVAGTVSVKDSPEKTGKRKLGCALTSSGKAEPLLSFLQEGLFPKDCHVYDSENISTQEIPQSDRTKDGNDRIKAMESLSGVVLLSLVKDILLKALKGDSKDWVSLVSQAYSLVSMALKNFTPDFISDVLQARNSRLACRKKALGVAMAKDRDLHNILLNGDLSKGLFNPESVSATVKALSLNQPRIMGPSTSSRGAYRGRPSNRGRGFLRGRGAPGGFKNRRKAFKKKFHYKFSYAWYKFSRGAIGHRGGRGFSQRSLVNPALGVAQQLPLAESSGAAGFSLPSVQQVAHPTQAQSALLPTPFPLPTSDRGRGNQSFRRGRAGRAGKGRGGSRGAY